MGNKVAQIQDKKHVLSERISIAGKYNDMFFPDNMPGWPDFHHANDNEPHGKALYLAIAMFREVNEIKDPIMALKFLEIVSYECSDAMRIAMILERGGVSPAATALPAAPPTPAE